MHQHTSAAALPSSVLAREDMREALASHNFGEVFRLARKWAGISYSLIAQVTDIKPERVGALARGKGAILTCDKMVRISEGLRIPGLLMGLAQQPWEFSDQKRSGLQPTLSNPMNSVLVHPAPAATDDPTLERRISIMIRRSVEFARATQSGPLGAEVITQIAEDLTHYASKLVHSSVFEVLGELAEFQDAIFTSIEDRRSNPHNARELYFAGAIVTGLVAHAMKDLDRMHEASTFARTAYVCAEAVRHNTLMTWAHGELSLIAYRRREYAKALTFADSAISISGDARGSTAIWARALRARALAQMGNHGEALTAVTELERSRDTHVPDDLDEIGGLFDFSEPKQHYYVSGALVDLPAASGRAASEAQRALDYYSASGGNYATEAGSRCELALARVRLGEFEGARAVLDPLLDLPPSRRVSGILESLDRVRLATLSLDIDSSAARAMSEDIHQFCRFPAATLIA